MNNNKTYDINWIPEENKIAISGQLSLQTVLNYFDLIDSMLGYVDIADGFVIFDISNLTVLNSSGIAAFALLINKMRDVEKKMIIHASKHVLWQTYSLDIFKELKDDIEIKYLSIKQENSIPA